MRKPPIYVTFDTNTYSTIARPQLQRLWAKNWPLKRDVYKAKWRRCVWWYINWCIKRGRIVAAIPEAAFGIEVLPNVQRISTLLAIGTPRAATPPTIPQTRLDIIKSAFETGFRVQHAPRVGYGALLGTIAIPWAADNRFSVADRHTRQSDFQRHFGDFSLTALRDLGERLATAHGLAAQHQHLATAARLLQITIARYLWLEGIEAEEIAPCSHPSVKAFQKVMRDMFADWADFDMVTAHVGYGYDFLCTEDQGSPRTNSIFGSQYGSDLVNRFQVRLISVDGLARKCWADFRFPLRKWKRWA